MYVSSSSESLESGGRAPSTNEFQACTELNLLAGAEIWASQDENTHTVARKAQYALSMWEWQRGFNRRNQKNRPLSSHLTH